MIDDQEYMNTFVHSNETVKQLSMKQNGLLLTTVAVTTDTCTSL